jgi:hypothetical protein
MAAAAAAVVTATAFATLSTSPVAARTAAVPGTCGSLPDGGVSAAKATGHDATMRSGTITPVQVATSQRHHRPSCNDRMSKRNDRTSQYSDRTSQSNDWRHGQSNDHTSQSNDW